MQDVLFVEKTEQAGALFHPLRVEVLKRLAEPRACPELAAELSETTQKIYYHVKILEKAGLVTKVEERRVRGIMEGLYQARARSYWLSAGLVGRVGGARRVRDEASLGYLLDLAADIHADVARLGERTRDGEVPSLGLSARIELDPRERAAFRKDVQKAFQKLAQKYGRSASKGSAESFQLSLVCYPKSDEKS